MKDPNPTADCPKCKGKKWFAYDENHATVCDQCCEHEQGYFQLTEVHGQNKGKWCCKVGCGHLKDTSHPGAALAALPALPVEALRHVLHLTTSNFSPADSVRLVREHVQSVLAALPALPAEALTDALSFPTFCKKHGLDPAKMESHGGMWARVALEEAAEALAALPALPSEHQK